MEKQMRKLKIEFHKEKCIGAFTCTQIAPSIFEELGNKAQIVGGINDGEWQTKEIECDEETAAKIIEAAEHCPVNVINVVDLTNHEKVVDSQVKETEEYKEIQAQYDDATEFVLDEKGYFLIRTIPEKNMIEVGFCGKRNKVEVKVYGKTPIEIYQTILREKIIERADHAAYLGRELQKAYTALRLGLPYVQDDPLDHQKQE